MNIPNDAIAAVMAADQGWPEEYSFDERVAIRSGLIRDLRAAAPFIAAQALRDFADAEFQRSGATGVVERLLARAQEIGQA